jgi:hypothetical protein
MTIGPDCTAQEREVSACTTTYFQHLIAGKELETINGFVTNSRREQEEPLKEEEEVSDTIVSVLDERRIEIRPAGQLHCLTPLND